MRGSTPGTGVPPGVGTGAPSHGTTPPAASAAVDFWSSASGAARVAVAPSARPVEPALDFAAPSAPSCSPVVRPTAAPADHEHEHRQSDPPAHPVPLVTAAVPDRGRQGLDVPTPAVGSRMRTSAGARDRGPLLRHLRGSPRRPPRRGRAARDAQGRRQRRGPLRRQGVQAAQLDEPAVHDPEHRRRDRRRDAQGRAPRHRAPRGAPRPRDRPRRGSRPREGRRRGRAAGADRDARPGARATTSRSCAASTPPTSVRSTSCAATATGARWSSR